MTSSIVLPQIRTPDITKGLTGPETGILPAQASSRLPPDIDRLSAVPSLGMVRDPNPKSNFIDLKNEETFSNKRASSIGAAFRRLFSSSPAPDERSPSETKTSGSVIGAGHRGRTPPKFSNSPIQQISNDSIESSTIPPNNPHYVPSYQQRATMGEWGGKQFISDSSTRAMAQTHRGAGALHSGAFQRGASTGGPGGTEGKPHALLKFR